MLLQLYDQPIDVFGFDLDGTLIMSEELNYKALEATCEHFGIPFNTRNDREFSGMPNAEMFQRIIRNFGYGSASALAQLIGYKREYYIKSLPEAKPVPNAVAFVRAVRRIGLPCAIATAAGSRSLTASLDVLGFSHDEFAVLLPADKLPPNSCKPNPYHWRKVAEGCGVSCDRLLVIEDSPRGLKSAVGAGCLTIGITTTHSENELWQAEVNYVVESFSELAELLNLDL